MFSAVKTWVADFRRVSSRRVYEFYRLSPGQSSGSNLEAGQLAARAYTDWAFIDTARQRPALIPEKLIADFFPEGAPREFPLRRAFPAAPPPPPDVYKTQLKVSFSNIDGMQHVNNATYLNYVTECGMQVIDHYGWPWQRMTKRDSGSICARTAFNIYSPRSWAMSWKLPPGHQTCAGRQERATIPSGGPPMVSSWRAYQRSASG